MRRPAIDLPNYEPLYQGDMTEVEAVIYELADIYEMEFDELSLEALKRCKKQINRLNFAVRNAQRQRKEAEEKQYGIDYLNIDKRFWRDRDNKRPDYTDIEELMFRVDRIEPRDLKKYSLFQLKLIEHTMHTTWQLLEEKVRRRNPKQAKEQISHLRSQIREYEDVERALNQPRN